MNVAAGERGRLRVAIIVILAVAVVTVTGLAFYLGRQNAIVDAIASRTQIRPAATTNPLRLAPKKFGNWTLGCALDAVGVQHCSLVFQAVDNTRKHILFRLSLVHAANGDVMLLILTPPSADAASGVKFESGSGAPIAVPIARCLPRACEARLSLSEPLLASLSAADHAQISFVITKGKPVSYSLPVQGFKEGYAAWRKVEVPEIDASGGAAAQTK